MVGTDDEIDQIFESCNDLLCAGDFAEVDRRLDAVAVGAEPIVILLAWLTITKAGKDQLKERAWLVRQTKWRLALECDARTATRLMAGLE